MPSPNVHEFIEQWKGTTLSERQSAQPHFIALCRLLGVPAPADNSADNENYCFDALTSRAGSQAFVAAAAQSPSRRIRARRAPTAADPALFPDSPAPRGPASSTRTRGFADVWKRAHFCWEYKRAGVYPDLDAALAQVKVYKDSLDNPPLLIVCDIDNFEIHTNFTGFPVETYSFTIDDLARSANEWHAERFPGLSALELLRRAFTDPPSFQPTRTLDAITEQLAAEMGDLAVAIGQHPGNDPHSVAHFIMQVVFCLFANDIGLIPNDLVKRIIRTDEPDPDRVVSDFRRLFREMADGGSFGLDPILHFNGGLFRNVETQKFPKLIHRDIGPLQVAARHNWSALEPSILGTLFERSLNPDKRAQIGAHYTSREDILLIVNPVIIDPLRAEWSAIKSALTAPAESQEAQRPSRRRGSATSSDSASTLNAFASRLASLRILDPACGSGNFLYVAIQQLLDLEKEVIAFAAALGVVIPQRVSPTQLLGLEINDYAAELARVSIWIGYLNWHRANGLTDPGRRPVLDALDTIENRDAILSWTDRNGHPIPSWRKGAQCTGPAPWPRADFIIGNPPFLGSKQFRANGLSDDYLKALYATYDLPKTSDLCCYWFELARRQLISSVPSGAPSGLHACVVPSPRLGLLATQGIRGGDNRTVLERIKRDGDIFMAWSDRDWILDGAAVHVSMVGFDNGSQSEKTLDGELTSQINADLTGDLNTTEVSILPQNTNIAFMGTTKGGLFELPWMEAARLLTMPNPHGQANSDVLKPWMNGIDLTQRDSGSWIVDFGTERSESDAARFVGPFTWIEEHVKSTRTRIRQSAEAKEWWLHNRPRPDLRLALAPCARFVVTCRVSKYRLFRWVDQPVLPDSATFAFARSDDYFFGVLHSCVHEVWSHRHRTQLEDRPRYTPTTCFETFPLPWSPGKEPAQPRARHHGLWKAISDAAAELNQLREAWLNPPEWIADVERKVDITYRDQLRAVPADVRPLVRRSAVMAEAAKDARLKERTLTNLYNERPAWLRLVHKRLDAAVLAAYAALDPDGDWSADWADVYEPFGAGEIQTEPKQPKRGLKTRRRAAGIHSEAAESDPFAINKAALAARQPIDERILANLLRLNHARARMPVWPRDMSREDLAQHRGRSAGQ